MWQNSTIFQNSVILEQEHCWKYSFLWYDDKLEKKNHTRYIHSLLSLLVFFSRSFRYDQWRWSKIDLVIHFQFSTNKIIRYSLLSDFMSNLTFSSSLKVRKNSSFMLRLIQLCDPSIESIQKEIWFFVFFLLDDFFDTTYITWFPFNFINFLFLENLSSSLHCRLIHSIIIREFFSSFIFSFSGLLRFVSLYLYIYLGYKLSIVY